MRSKTFLVLAALGMAACGSSESPPVPPPTYSIAGTVSGAVASGVTVALAGASSATTTTATNGTYSFAGLANGTYTVTPSLAGHTFTPTSATVVLNGSDFTGQNFTAVAASHGISGAVSGAVTSGVSIALSGAASRATTTDSSGNYSFTGLANGTYTVTPSIAGYSFSPASISVTVSGGSQTGKNFTATALTYGISGAVSGSVLSGVTVTMSGSASRTTTTDASGNFAFTGLTNGSYGVAPSLTGYSFSPTSRVATVNGADVTAVNFVASGIVGPTYAISGTVSGAVAAGVTVTLGGAASGTAVTDSSGAFAFASLANGNYTVTPALAGYSFAPVNASVTVNGADVTGRNFVASVVTHGISGAVSGAVVAGVTVTLTGAASRTTATDGSGNYAFTGLSGGSYTITPTLAGYSFSPTSLAATVSGADVTGKNFTSALLAIYAISGTVSGSVASDVTVTLSGTASGTTTTGAGGTYSFGSLTNGSYTVTPTRSNYGFNPANRSVTVAGSSQSGQDFTSSAAATYSLSGTVTGPWVENVLVTLGGAATSTTRTNASGAYSFQGLYAGSYTVTPALAGYGYNPASPTVVISGASVTQGFLATPLVIPSSISGTVLYGGSRTGRVYVSAFDNGCMDCQADASTSLTAPGAYTLRGIRAGASFRVVAWRDTVGSGATNASDPIGVSNPVAVPYPQGDVTGVEVVMTDPTPPAPQTPTGLKVYPSDQGSVVFWNAMTNASGIETSTAYKIYWGTDALATNRTPVVVPASANAYMKGNLTNGDVLYYKMTSLVGTAESSPTAVFGPVTIGAIAGANVLTGSVTFGVPATGALFVGAFDMVAGTMRGVQISNPVSPQAYTITGIPSGNNYMVVAILDQNNTGYIGEGNPNNTNQAGTIAITGPTTRNVVLTGANADVFVITDHRLVAPGSHTYAVRTKALSQAKRAVAVTMYSGPDVLVPVNLGYNSYNFQSGQNWESTRPTVGATYGLKVWYSDGTTELKTGTLTTVLDSFATSLSVERSPSANVPTFHWAAPTTPPDSYNYQFQLWGSGANWYYPRRESMPSTQTSVWYNVDGNAYPTSLVTGSTYYWQIQVRDREENTASVEAVYVP